MCDVFQQVCGLFRVTSTIDMCCEDKLLINHTRRVNWNMNCSVTC